MRKIALITGSIVAVFLLSGCGNSSTDSTTDGQSGPKLHILPVLADEDGNSADGKATYTLNATVNTNVQIETPNGSWTTPMWRYNNNPLPLVIRANRGDKMTLNFTNSLGHESTIHWHGFKIPADMDGGPDYPVAPGSGKVYSFTMDQPAAPLWFHPHPDMQTGKQVYMGLAGVLLLDDDISRELESSGQLPSGERDVVLLVQDRRFGLENNGVKELRYMDQAMDSDGMLGDTVLVNGSQFPNLQVSTAKYRLRLYNVSNARNYDFAFSDGRQFTIVATDGGLLKNPVRVDHIFLGAAERVELIVDFSADSTGKNVSLISREFQDDNMNMGDMNGGGNMESSQNDGNMSGDTGNENMPMDGRVPNGTPLDIMSFRVSKKIDDPVTIYTSLPERAEITNRLDPGSAVNLGNERIFNMTMKMGSMTFVINGKSFDPSRVDEYVGANTTEIWNIKNNSPMTHPFHAHAIQWQILDRNGVPASGTDLGWKDTFLVRPGENVRIIGRFEPINYGDYMYHCHILEHEDLGMMGYFRVGDSGHLDSL